MESAFQRVPVTEKRPIWFVYSGMGTHYVGMGKELATIGVFQQTLRRCSDALKAHKVDPYDLIMNGGSDGIYCAVCICAIQVKSCVLTIVDANNIQSCLDCSD